MAWQYSSVLDCRLSFLHLPSGRCGHTMCAYHDSLVLFGGFDGTKWLNDLHLLNTVSMVWTQPRLSGCSPEPRQYHTAGLLADQMYVFGGYSGTSWLSDLLVLNLKALVWRRPHTTGDHPSAKEGHAMTVVGTSLFVLGGWDGTAVSDLHRLDTVTLVWTRLQVAGEQPAMCGHSLNLIKDSLFVFGGYNGQTWSSAIYRLDLTQTALKWERMQTSGSPRARGYHSSVVVSRFILIYAGYNGTYILGDLLAFDTESKAWSFPDPFSEHTLEARNAHTMTKLGSELYLFGGYNGLRDTNDVHVLESAAFSTLHDDLAAMWQCPLWKDVELIAGYAHRSIHSAIIRARSPILYLEMIENCPDFPNFPTQFLLPSISQAALDLFCEYLYTDAIRDECSQSVKQDLTQLADMYLLKRLKLLCAGESDIPESTLALDIMKIRFFADLSDLTLVIGEERFQTHRLVLASRCPYFKAMLQSNMQETSLNLIKMPGISPAAFHVILDWIYSDKFSSLFSSTALDIDLGLVLLRDTGVLLLDSLKRMTEMALQKQVTVKSVCALLEASLECRAEKLKSNCVNYVLKHFERVDKRDIQALSEPAKELVLSYLPRNLQKQAKMSPKQAVFVKLDPTPPSLPVLLNVQGAKLSMHNSPRSTHFRPKANTVDEVDFKQSLSTSKSSLARAGREVLAFYRTRSSLL
jgi:hypothetical protein